MKITQTLNFSTAIKMASLILAVAPSNAMAIGYSNCRGEITAGYNSSVQLTLQSGVFNSGPYNLMMGVRRNLALQCAEANLKVNGAVGGPRGSAQFKGSEAYLIDKIVSLCGSEMKITCVKKEGVTKHEDLGR